MQKWNFSSSSLRGPECSGWGRHQHRQWENLGLCKSDFWKKRQLYNLYSWGWKTHFVPVQTLADVGWGWQHPQKGNVAQIYQVYQLLSEEIAVLDGLEVVQTVVAIAGDLQYYLIIFSQNLKEGHSVFCWDFINTSFVGTVWKHSAAHTSK